MIYVIIDRANENTVLAHAGEGCLLEMKESLWAYQRVTHAATGTNSQIELCSFPHYLHDDEYIYVGLKLPDDLLGAVVVE